jgi:20S proteasome subunit beta 7
MLTADTLASYGSLAQIRDMERIKAFGKNTCIAASGDMSDWQYIGRKLDALLIKEHTLDDEHQIKPDHIYEYLKNIMYNRRSESNPLWNSLIVAGSDFLAFVDLQGTTYQASTIATGYGAYIAQPLLRKAVEGNEHTLTEAQAIKILDDCNRVLFYRDARSLNKV